MSDYTPITSTIRGAYIRASRSSRIDIDHVLAAEFDRWFEAQKAEWAVAIVKATEQRIIKLLEGLDDWGSIDTAFVPELIALIKGEGERQKDNETVVLLTGRDYDYMAKVIKGDNK